MTPQSEDGPDVLAELAALRARVRELEGTRVGLDPSVLSTVRVPSAIEVPFLRAQAYVASYFSQRVEDPRRSTISIAGERYVLVRAASMSVEFFDLVSSLYQDRGDQQAQAVAKNLLFDLAHSLGKADARAFHTKMGVTDPIEKMSAGPVHFSFAGWAFVSILPESRPAPDDSFFLIYDHPFAFESDAWLKRGRRTDFPVCIMNAGYSSGWCEESFSLPLVATEITCRAQGDAQCRFIMAPPARIEEHLEVHMPRGRSHPRAAVEVPEFFQRKRLEEALERSHVALEDRVRARTAELALTNAKLESEIAERKHSEAERLRLEAQVRHTQKLESLGVMAGGIAHDFNNLLVGILGNAGLALMQLPAGSAARTSIESLETAAQRAAELTRQMLAYSGRGRFVVERVDLSQLVAEMGDLLSSAVSKNATVKRALSPNLPWLQADATELRQVVMNLITNSSEALGTAGGTIWLRTGEADVDAGYLAQCLSHEGSSIGHHVFLEVEDTGCGMDEATRARMFDPFFTTKFTGRGLGLAAVLGIVRGHRGIIRLTSEPTRGTTFRVLFPLPPDATATASPGRATMPSEHASAGRTSVAARQTVLVVDDEPAVRELAAAALSDAGFTVLVASSGQEALTLHEKHRGQISLILLDLTMPGMSGEQTLRTLRERDREVRVILSSGYSEDEVTGHLQALRLSAFLQKPYRVTDLLTRVRAALSS